MKGLTVALIGADGAGKTTLCRRLCAELPQPTKYVYMGVNWEASDVLLPTTRLWLGIIKLLGGSSYAGGPPGSRPVRKKSGIRGLFASMKSLLRVGNIMCEEWYRQLLIWKALRRRAVVLMDRHFFIDYYSHDIAPLEGHRGFASRLHGWMLMHWYPKPQVVIFLDAPAEILFARKSEGTEQLLEDRRREYWRLKEEFKHFYVLDAAAPMDDIVEQANSILARHLSGTVLSPLESTPMDLKPALEQQNDKTCAAALPISVIEDSRTSGINFMAKRA